MKYIFIIIFLFNTWALGDKPNIIIRPKKKPIIVAVIDTGFDFKSKWWGGSVGPDGRRVKKPKLCKYGHKDFTNSKYGLQDMYSHGTPIAGIIDKFAGDSHYCIVVLKITDDDDRTKTSNSIKAIQYAINIKVDIINYSIGGGGFFEPMRRVFTKALDAGIIIVCSAGNSSMLVNYFFLKKRQNKILFINKETNVVTSRAYDLYYPSSLDERIISVGSINESGKISDFSNYGSVVDTYEVGEKVYSICPNNKYCRVSGTSFSAPTAVGKIIKNWRK